MPWAEFEEKEYETAAIVELAAGKFGYVWSPGQVLENTLGFDLATNPGADHLLWKVLGAQRPPGLRLVPDLWGSSANLMSSDLPQAYVSIVLQFKRPEYLKAPQAKQWRLWGRPYYRFTRSTAQHRTLRGLERNIGEEGLVRYAAPAFWRRSALESAHIRRCVLADTGFVSPTLLGSHRVWTYRSAGGIGKPNAGGSERPFSSSEQVRTQIDELLNFADPVVAPDLPVLAVDPLAQHLIAVGEAARQRNPNVRIAVDRWMRELDDPELRIPDERMPALRGFASMSLAVQSAHALWLVAPRSERGHR